MSNELSSTPAGDQFTVPLTDIIKGKYEAMSAPGELERRQVEEKLKASETRYRRLFESAKDGILILNADTGKIIDVNPFLSDLIGYSHKELFGKTLWEIGLFQDVVASKASFAELQNIGYIRYEDLPLLTRKGKQIDVEFVSNVYPVVPENVIQCNIRDITLRKQAEKKLQETNRELEQFAYVASHDLQEPLRTVISFVQLLERRYKDQFDENALEYLKYIVEGSKRMQQLVEDLLQFSRIGRTGIETSPTDCNRIMDKAILNLTDSIGKTGAEVTHDVLPVINANESRIIQLFQNLVGNALKFHKKGESPCVHISARQDKGFWLFSVKDNGIGINPIYYDKIFMIFQRLNRIDDFPGTGIGLAITRKIVETYGGKIWVESTEGEGATFYFTFPN